MNRFQIARVAVTGLTVAALTGAAAVPAAAVGSPYPTVARQWDGIVSVGDPFTGVFRPVAPSASTPGEQLHPAFSPDGRKVTFAVDDTDGSRDIWTADVRTGAATRVVDCVPPACFFVDEPAYSPDGRSIAFEQVLVGPNAEGRPSLQVLDLASKRQRAVATFPADYTPYTPSWSPGGRALVYELDRFASTRADEEQILNHRIQTVDIPTGRKTTLTDPADDAQIPDWNSRDGRIVYVQPFDHAKGFFGPLDLVVIDRTGKHLVTHLGAVGERALQPAWTPDGRSIVFVYERELCESKLAFLDPITGRITVTTTPGTHPRVQP